MMSAAISAFSRGFRGGLVGDHPHFFGLFALAADFVGAWRDAHVAVFWVAEVCG
jgi:hypothetical protein